MTNLLPIAAGGAIAVAGADKLMGQRGYRGMFHGLGWSDEEMRAAAVAETAGGLFMMSRATRRIGGALVAGVSAAVLLSELRNGEPKLAGPRALVMLAGLAAMVAPGR